MKLQTPKQAMSKKASTTSSSARQRQNSSSLPDVSNEQLFRSIFDVAVIPTALAGRNAKFIRVNPAYCDFVGYSEEEIFAMEPCALTHDDDIEKKQELNRQLLAGQIDSFSMEMRYKHKTRESIWVLLNISAVHNAEGLAEYFIEQVTDITDCKRAEQAVKESEEKYRSIVEASAEWICEIDVRTSQHTYCNPAIEAIMGYTAEEFLAMDMLDLISESNRPRIQAYISSCIDKKCGWKNLSIQCRHKDGSYRYLQSNAVAVLDSNDELISFQIINHDVTELKRANEELQRRDERLSEAQRMARLGFWEWNITEDTLYWSDELYTLLELDAKIFAGNYQALFELVHPDDRQDFQNAMDAAVDGVRPFKLDHRFVLASGETRYHYAQGEVAYDEGGVPVHMFGVSMDVTERKLSEQVMTENAEWWSKTQQVAHVGFFELDLVKDKLRGSDELYNIFGIKLDEFGAGYKDLLELIYPDDRENVETCINLALKEEKIFNIDHRILRPAGGLRYVHVRGEVARDASGTPLRMSGIVFDITERRQVEETLQLYEQILNASTDAMAIVGADYTYLAANQRYLDAFKITRDEAIGHQMAEIIGEDNFKIIAKPNLDKALAGESFRNQRWFYRPGFDRRYLDVSNIPYRDARDAVTGVVISVHDITEQKLAEDALRENEELLRRFYDAGLVGMSTSSPEKGLVQFNDTYCEMMGYSREELQGMTWLQLTHPDDVEEQVIEHNRVLSGEIDGYIKDKRCIRKDGHIIYLTVTAKCARKPDGTVDYFVAFVQDISERKKAEQALRKSEVRFSKAFYNILDAVVIYRLSDNKILFFNPAFLTLTGFTADEVVGKKADELDTWVVPEERDAYIKLVEKEGGVKDFEATSRRKNGEIFPVLLSASRIEMDGEDCLVGWAHDLSKIRQVEEERQQLEQKLFQSQKMEAIGQLTGGIAHDFNNILASILGYTNLAIKRCVQDKESKLANYLDEIRHGGERARDLIEQMMTYSRVIPGVALNIDLQPVVEQSLRLLRPTLPSNIDIYTGFAELTPKINFDPAQLEQIIMNLCINARDAIEASGSIDIDVETASYHEQSCVSCHDVISGDFVILSVRDSGTGIDIEMYNRIFEPFFTTKEVGRGTGMGLSMVHGIMHEFGGHIFVDSTVGEGTAFVLLFPIIDTEFNESEIHVQAEENELDAEHRAGVIMVVDDEPSVANYMGELLGSHGYEVIVMTDSLLALDTFRMAPKDIDIVITDQTMPGITGLELARELLSLRPDMPIIISTGFSGVLNEEVAEEEGIRAYFNKPVDSYALLNKINNILSSTEKTDVRVPMSTN